MKKKKRNEASHNSFSGSTLAKSTAATSHPPASSRKSKSNMKYWEEAELLHPVDFSKNILHTAAAASIFVWHITSQIVGCCAAAIALPWCYSPISRLSLSLAVSLSFLSPSLSRAHSALTRIYFPSYSSSGPCCWLSLSLRLPFRLLLLLFVSCSPSTSS